MKRALIAVNQIGFVHFLWEDIDLLHELGYEVSLVADNTLNEDYTLDALKERHVDFYNICMDSKNPFSKKNWIVYKHYKEILINGQFNLVHCHTPIVAFMMRMAARSFRKNGMKVFYTSHGTPFSHLSSRKEYLKYHTLESLASRFTDAIITINREDYENAKKMHCDNVYMINGIGFNMERILTTKIDVIEYKKQNGIPLDKIVLIAAGELSSRKNHIAIVKALAQMPNKDKFVYLICGRVISGNSTADKIVQLAKETRVNVKLMGYRTDMPCLFHCADIGVIPSIREGLGLAGVQQLAAGKPVIGSDVQGIRDYVIDGKTGYTINPFDISSITIALEKLSDKRVREAMKENCVSMAGQFTKEISVAQRRDIYYRLLG